MFRIMVFKDGVFAGYLKYIKKVLFGENVTYYEIVDDMHDGEASDSETYLQSLAANFLGRFTDQTDDEGYKLTTELYDLRPIY